MTLHRNVLLLLLVLPLASTRGASITVGNTRVTALSPTLLRVEPRGPLGFEDQTTFMVVNRSSFGGIPIAKANESAAGTLLSTAHFDVLLKTGSTPPPPAPGCGSASQTGTDVSSPVRSSNFRGGASAADGAACCKLCESDATCTAWVHATAKKGGTSGADDAINCWPLASFGATTTAGGRELGCTSRAGGCKTTTMPPFVVTDKAGATLFDSSAGGSNNKKANLLHWPSPLAQPAYALVDYPRFFVPEW